MTSTIGIIVYKLACLMVGLLICYFGYRLFLAGVTGKAGDVKGEYAGGKLEIRSAAPGTFFALLGGAVVIFTIVTGLTLDRDASSTSIAAAPAQPNTDTHDPSSPDASSESLAGAASQTGFSTQRAVEILKNDKQHYAGAEEPNTTGSK